MDNCHESILYPEDKVLHNQDLRDYLICYIPYIQGRIPF